MRWYRYFVFIFIYPVVVVLGVGVYKWRDDNWQRGPFVTSCLTFATSLALAFFIIIAIVYDPWWIGATGIAAFIVIMLLAVGLPMAKVWATRWYSYILTTLILLLLGFCIAVGVETGRGFIV
jgi:uncharacterized membrane protein